MDKYEKVIDSKISKIKETDFKELLKDPDALKKMVQQETALIGKFGKEKYDQMLALAAEKMKKN